MKFFLILLIKIYQKTLSPDHGIFSSCYPYGFCRHHPTCSQFAKEKIESEGIIKGCTLSMLRIIRCNPFSRVSDERTKEICCRIRATGQ
ncbi:membrane protein insertion efficiency factor YidD [Candidatus Peribacteria bacterium]|nr:membrane protein insertion efficiency factor YidD [Candidatus Peribacteria bacterium]MBT4021298.1 membrane protein insertion efficiency factor YidD [Candidatus Peribacteria bacterium]MBT4241241.1 membrane protein insertion efficiency factor YidD [Candidatus Peribacteria bacterium]MBT4474266.1 membrane protein insertion efficiency factor YidD [Candidatus Peribacteria bacterium]